jgi:hypothetical protein
MSDDLEIRGGGAVAVDTATLRTAADGFVGLAVELNEIAGVVGSTGLRLFELSPAMWDASGTIEGVRQRILAVTEEADVIVAALRFAADVYDIVELRAERAAAHAAGDEAAVARIDARLARAVAERPDAGGQASLAAFAHWLTWPGELARQAPGTLGWISPGFALLAAPLAWSAQRAVGALGAGTVPATSRLTGAPKPVIVTPLATKEAAVAPRSLADTAARIPNGEARVRVERYSMPDGTRQFAVYVTGTQTWTPRTGDPFDAASNIELYSGERSASYEATLAALAASGAAPGDVVHAFGHSQGAMVTAHLALEGGFDTRTLVSFGSPVEADVGDGTLSIAVRHRDDPVAALEGGGHPGAVGAPGSFIAERTADPQLGLHDFGFPAHGIGGYTDTARMLDASTDARMGPVRDLFDELGGAASVEVTEYSAQRAALLRPQPLPGSAPLSPASSGAG